jgi:acetyl esterase
MTDQKKPILEPTTQAFVDALATQGGEPLYELSYADARKLLEDAQAIEVTKLPADVEDRTLPVGPGGETSVRIYRPKGAKGAFAGRDVLPWRGLDLGKQEYP